MLKREEMNEVIREELEHIPRGDSLQNDLRAIYPINRKRSLGKNAKTIATKEEILTKSIDFIKNQHSSFKPQYDPGFFMVKI